MAREPLVESGLGKRDGRGEFAGERARQTTRRRGAMFGLRGIFRTQGGGVEPVAGTPTIRFWARWRSGAAPDCHLGRIAGHSIALVKWIPRIQDLCSESGVKADETERDSQRRTVAGSPNPNRAPNRQAEQDWRGGRSWVKWFWSCKTENRESGRRTDPTGHCELRRGKSGSAGRSLCRGSPAAVKPLYRGDLGTAIKMACPSWEGRA